MKVSVFTDRWEMNHPFVTSKNTVQHIDTITVCIARDGICGRGEALGVDYLGENADTMRGQIEAVRAEIEAGAGIDEINCLLPPGGARNAVDCALWDLRSKHSGKRAWDILGIPSGPVTTAYTLSLDSPENMAREALDHAKFPLLKLKLNQDEVHDSLGAIRAARPDATLVVDANCSWSLPFMETVQDDLLAFGVEMVEQPLPMGEDGDLEGFEYPVILCADESCQSYSDLEYTATRYQMANIKLDKCGGLTEAMRMVHWCRDNGLELMVGNMLGSSLAMAPGFLVAQYCRYVDLDGPLLQRTDRSAPLLFDGAIIQPPDRALWG